MHGVPRLWRPPACQLLLARASVLPIGPDPTVILVANSPLHRPWGAKTGLCDSENPVSCQIPEESCGNIKRTPNSPPVSLPVLLEFIRTFGAAGHDAPSVSRCLQAAFPGLRCRTASCKAFATEEAKILVGSTACSHAPDSARTKTADEPLLVGGWQD
jgi:hypothetical protein